MVGLGSKSLATDPQQRRLPGCFEGRNRTRDPQPIAQIEHTDDPRVNLEECTRTPRDATDCGGRHHDGDVPFEGRPSRPNWHVDRLTKTDNPHLCSSVGTTLACTKDSGGDQHMTTEETRYEL